MFSADPETSNCASWLWAREVAHCSTKGGHRLHIGRLQRESYGDRYFSLTATEWVIAFSVSSRGTRFWSWGHRILAQSSKTWKYFPMSWNAWLSSQHSPSNPTFIKSLKHSHLTTIWTSNPLSSFSLLGRGKTQSHTTTSLLNDHFSRLERALLHYTLFSFIA